MAVLRGLVMLTRLVFACKNWVEIVRWRVVGAKPPRIVLRRSGPIESTSDPDLWNHFSDIWLHRSYGKSPRQFSGRTVLDCGANIGIFSLYALWAGAARVVSVEPDPTVFEVMSRNTAGWGERCHRLRAALSDANGEQFLHIAQVSTASHLIDRESDETIIVPTLGLSGLLAQVRGDREQAPERLVLKLDCEGAEGCILKGGSTELAAMEYVVLEYHSPGNREVCERILTDAGFSVGMARRGDDFGMMYARRD